jgi:hypothetical protein
VRNIWVIFNDGDDVEFPATTPIRLLPSGVLEVEDRQKDQVIKRWYSPSYWHSVELPSVEVTE